VTSERPLALLGGQSAAGFLARHWQKQPLLVRAAFSQRPALLSAEELAGLALDDEVESRVVMGDTDAEDWTLLEGPFSEAFFSDTPDRDWTLLVQDVDKHVPAMNAWLAPFRFLPDWRRDDLMISYAAPGGTVGPHVDSYDVFLIQAEGRRRWSIQQPAPVDPPLRAGSPLRLLRDFHASDSWVLEPGDMLYLPPGIPHYGIALDAGMTLSVGFRAPSASELLAEWARYLASHARSADSRYADPDLRPTDAPGRVDGRALARLRGLLRQALDADDRLLDDFLGRSLTAPKPAFRSLERGVALAPPRLEAALASHRRLVLNPAVRLALLPDAEGDEPRLYVQGDPVSMPHAAAPPVERLTDGGALAIGDLDAEAQVRHAQLALLADWYGRGWLWFEDELTEAEDG
jgi:50S ribosomal protein L16 3-hydroxylase